MDSPMSRSRFGGLLAFLARGTAIPFASAFGAVMRHTAGDDVKRRAWREYGDADEEKDEEGWCAHSSFYSCSREPAGPKERAKARTEGVVEAGKENPADPDEIGPKARRAWGAEKPWLKRAEGQR